jgi:hypothetical protein
MGEHLIADPRKTPTERRASARRKMLGRLSRTTWLIPTTIRKDMGYRSNKKLQRKASQDCETLENSYATRATSHNKKIDDAMVV